MRRKLVLNDVHLGVRRAAGTTPQSAAALRAWLQKSLRDTMMEHLDKDIIINGDLFDEFMVPMQDVLDFYATAAEWLDRSQGFLALGAGNHDLSKDSSRLSSFEFAGRILQMNHPDRVALVTEPTMVFEGIYMIPHLPNQDLFDHALAEVPAEARYVLIHVNYHNGYTVQSDHSLNLSEEQADVLLNGRPDRVLVFGHEHQFRTAASGHVLITGNQWPSSVADCLRNPHNQKLAYTIGEDGLDSVGTWSGDKDFIDADWEQLFAVGEQRFIRVSGSAKAEQAPDVIAAVAKFRQQSNAFIVSNNVQIEGVKEMEDLPASIEMTKQFDVLGYLLEQLDDQQRVVVQRLIEKADLVPA